MTVAQALAEAKAQGVDRLDAQLLLARALSCSRSWLLVHDDAVLTPQQAAGFRAHMLCRADDEPLAYLLGEKEFHSLVLKVSADVLVPRPETELLVDWGLELLELLGRAQAGPAQPWVLDLGTGSGAIALAVKHARPNAQVSALDLSPGALAVAGANAGRLGLAIELLQGHWWGGVGDRRFDLVLSNPPYIRQDDPHLAALRHEPRIALTPGGDGLDALRAIVAGAADHLEPGGWLLLEHGHDQAQAVQTLLSEQGFVGVQTRSDLAGLPRCTGAHRRGR
jgi:release factor glutamine methyltransferase